MATPFSIEKKAILAQGDDPDAVRALVDEVFDLPLAVPHLPADIRDIVEDRITRAEILYRQGANPGVKEQDIVGVINSLVDKFGGPPHAKITVSQLRVLRMSLALGEPKFMGAGVARDDGSIGEPVSSTMSPAQAINLIRLLINQKFINPDFQVTPEEWERTSLRKAKERIKEVQGRIAAQRASGQRSVTTLSVRSYSPAKRRELEQTLYPKISSLTPVQGRKLIDQILARMHIN